MKSLVILIAAVCFGVAVGENSKPIFEVQKKWPLIGALKLLQPHTDLVTRSVQPRQAVFGNCTIDELVGLVSAVPPDCSEDFADITALFNNVLIRDPATLTEVYRIFCTPRCGDPFVGAFYACGLNEIGDAAMYLCSNNAAGTPCYELFDPLLADTSAAVSSCLSSTAFSCSFSCSDALTTLRSGSGCCVNFLNDSTVETTALSTLEYDLWDECGVSVPDFCDLDTSSLSSAMAVTLSKILFVGLLFAVVVFIP